MNHKARIAKLEKQAAKSQPTNYDVQIVDEITDEMRQDQREAHARGERYYIIEESEDE